MIISETYKNIYTNSNQAIQILFYIRKALNDYNICLKNNGIIVDGTAGMGGNSVYFCRYFDYVYSIDVSDYCITYLEHNLKEYQNKFIINDNCLDILKIIKFDILFLDPPWGGSNYKSYKSLNLYLSGYNLNYVIEELYTKCKLIAIKVPINYNLNTNSLWKIKINKIYKITNKLSYYLIIYHK